MGMVEQMDIWGHMAHGNGWAHGHMGDTWHMGMVGHTDIGDTWDQPDHGPLTLCLMAGIRPTQPELMADPASVMARLTWKSDMEDSSVVSPGVLEDLSVVPPEDSEGVASVGGRLVASDRAPQQCSPAVSRVFGGH